MYVCVYVKDAAYMYVHSVPYVHVVYIPNFRGVLNKERCESQGIAIFLPSWDTGTYIHTIDISFPTIYHL